MTVIQFIQNSIERITFAYFDKYAIVRNQKVTILALLMNDSIFFHVPTCSQAFSNTMKLMKLLSPGFSSNSHFFQKSIYDYYEFTKYVSLFDTSSSLSFKQGYLFELAMLIGLFACILRVRIDSFVTPFFMTLKFSNAIPLEQCGVPLFTRTWRYFLHCSIFP